MNSTTGYLIARDLPIHTIRGSESERNCGLGIGNPTLLSPRGAPPGLSLRRPTRGAPSVSEIGSSPMSPSRNRCSGALRRCRGYLLQLLGRTISGFDCNE